MLQWLLWCYQNFHAKNELEDLVLFKKKLVNFRSEKFFTREVHVFPTPESPSKTTLRSTFLFELEDIKLM
jgi:hypothetical protein